MGAGRRKLALLWALGLTLACAQHTGQARDSAAELGYEYPDLPPAPQGPGGNSLRGVTIHPPLRSSPLVRALNTAHGGRVCSTWGDFHYKTFDGDVFRFPGLCNYVFSAHCGAAYEDFNLQLRRGPGPNATAPSRVTMKLDGMVVELTKGSVLVNGRPAQLPFSHSGVFIEQSSSYVKVAAKLGLVFMWNQDDSLLLELDAKYANQTCGLCGDFNGVPIFNEFFSHNIKLTPTEFGNLQKMDGPTERCQDPAPEPPTNCLTGFGICEEMLSSELFSDCAALVDTSSYLEACRQDLCRCDQANPSSCLCHTLAEYSRQCSHAGGLPLDWRRPQLCPQTCPLNMQYRECGSPCADTCSNPEHSPLCEDHCVAGCFCPEGTVLDDIGHAGCIPVPQCSCVYNGATYTPGTGYSTDCTNCTCSGGRWRCQEVQCPGTCSVLGGAHFSTFDERQYTVHGDCSYVLAKPCDSSAFTVLAELRRCGLTDSETCLKSLTLILGGGHMVFVVKASGEVFVNQIYTQLPLSAANVTLFRPSTFFIIAQTQLGLQLDVQLVPVMQVFVRLAPQLRGQTCGLCGNFNQNQADDFRTISGVVEGTAAAFANTWKTQAACPNVKNGFEDPCSLSVENEKYAQRWCSRLTDPHGPFARCHAAVNPSAYYSNCMFDTCSCEKSEDCMCAALSSYVRACAARGVLLSGWRDGVCTKPMTTCPKSLTYLYNISTCQPTCRARSDADVTCSVSFVPVDGCTCPDGTFLDDMGKCVPATSCPCYRGGSVVPDGESTHEQGVICTCTQGTLTCIGGHAPAPVCTPPMVYFDCRNTTPGAAGAGCQKSCHTLDMDCYSSQCVPGCVCPHGLVASGDGGCIPVSDCPCVHNEASYQPGQIIRVGCNTCTCKSRMWQCTDQPCSATCAVYGDGHYLTFDGQRYSFSGDCEYTLLQDHCGGNGSAQDGFRVITENVPCGTTGTTCSKAIKIFLGVSSGWGAWQGAPRKAALPWPSRDRGHRAMDPFDSYELKLSDGNVEVIEKEQGQLPPFSIRQMGIYLVVDTDVSLVLLWDKGTSIFLRLSPEFKGRVCGLCGNFDDNALNDFTTRSQSVVGDALEFGNSWKFSPSCPDAQAPKDPCAANPYRKSWAQKQCSIVNSATFSACHAHVESARYYEACVSDACACDSGGDCECFCTAVAAYAQACHEAGVCVSWRTPDVCPLFCDYYNPQGQCEWHYQPCGAPFLRTCRNPRGQYLHDIRGLEGCYPKCPSEAPIFDEDQMRCVASCPTPTPPTPCRVQGKSYRPGSTVPLEKNCHYCVCTESGVHCTYNSEACVCTYDGKRFRPGEVIYHTMDGTGGCISAHCGANGTIERRVEACSPTPRTPQTTFVFSTTPFVMSSTLPPSTHPSPSESTAHTPSSAPATTPGTSPGPTPPTASSPPSSRPHCGEECQWSPWLDVSRPGWGIDSGDFDTLENLRAYGYRVCRAPRAVECRAEGAPEVPLEVLGQHVECSPTVGLTCYNRDQASGRCDNYQIRILCCSPRACPTSSTETTPPATFSTTETGPTPGASRVTSVPTGSTGSSAPVSTPGPTTASTTSKTPGPGTSTPAPGTSTTGKTTLSTPSRAPVSTTVTTTTSVSTTTPGPSKGTSSEPTQVTCLQESCTWTKWIDGSYPGAGRNSGDFDSFQNLRSKGYKFCAKPKNVECRAEVFPNTPLQALGQNLICDKNVGLICWNKDQLPPICYNYQIRILCCEVVDVCRTKTTPPTTPGPTQTTTGETSTAWATATFSSSTQHSTASSAHVPPRTRVTARTNERTSPGTTSCQPQCTWTKWFDVDFPFPGPHGGDFETYSNIVRRGEKICHRPEYISALECRAENHPDVSIQTLGQVVQCSPEVGLVCRNRDQKGKFRMCLNYEVRVLCCEPQKGCTVTHVTVPSTSSTTSQTTGPTVSTTTVETTSTTTVETTGPTTAPTTSTTTAETVSTTTAPTTSTTTVERASTTSAPITSTTTVETTGPNTAPTTSTTAVETTSTNSVEKTSPTTGPTTSTTTVETTGPTSAPTTSTTTVETASTTSAPTTSTTTVETTSPTTAPTTSTTTVETTGPTSAPTTSTTFVPIPETTPSQLGTTSCQPQCTWTKWFDADFPSPGPHGGDFETYSNIVRRGEKICHRPEYISALECRAENHPDVSIQTLGQVVQCSPEVGLVCRNRDQKGKFRMCLNYEVRVLCCEPQKGCTATHVTVPSTSSVSVTSHTRTTSREATSSATTVQTTSPTAVPTTSTASVETTSPTSAPTTSTTTVETASTTSAPRTSTTTVETTSPTTAPTTSTTTVETTSTTSAPTTSTTFVPIPETTPSQPGTTSCQPQCLWTKWFDVDFPFPGPHGGDFETYSNIVRRGEKICHRPEYISALECRAENHPDVSIQTLGQVVQCSPEVGLVCRNRDQKGKFRMCLNYEVRVLCCEPQEGCTVTHVTVPSTSSVSVTGHTRTTSREATSSATTVQTTSPTAVPITSTASVETTSTTSAPTTSTTTVETASTTPVPTISTTTVETTSPTTAPRTSTTTLEKTSPTTAPRTSTTTVETASTTTPPTISTTTVETTSQTTGPTVSTTTVETTSTTTVETTGPTTAPTTSTTTAETGSTTTAPTTSTTTVERASTTSAPITSTTTVETTGPNTAPTTSTTAVETTSTNSVEKTSPTTGPTTSTTTVEITSPTSAPTTSTTTVETTGPTSAPTTSTTTVETASTTSAPTTSTTTVETTSPTTAPTTSTTTVETTGPTSAPTTSTTFVPIPETTPSQLGTTSCQPQCTWTKWFDADFPSPGPHGGDFETYSNIVRRGEKICHRPEYISALECRAENHPDVSIQTLGQVVQCSPEVGLVCRNRDQKGKFRMCLNYEVRVLCCEPQKGCTATHVTVPSTSSVSVTSHTRTTSREATSSATTVQTTSPTAVPITSTASVETTSTTSAPTASTTTVQTASTTSAPTTSTTTVETTSPTTAPRTSTTTVETVSTASAPTTSTTTVETTSPTTAPTTSTSSMETTSTNSVEKTSTTSAPTTSTTTVETTSPTTAPRTSTTPVETTGPTTAPTRSTTTVETISPTTAPRTSTTTVETASTTSAPTTSTTTVETASPTTAPRTSTTTIETASTTSAPRTSTTTVETASPTTAPTTSTTTVETTSTTSAPTTSTTFVPIPETTPSQPGTTSCQPQCLWTKWFDVDFPFPGPHGGDFETYSNIVRRGEKICHRPEYISTLECRAENHPDVSIQTLGQVVQCSPEVGLVCRNRDQKGKFRMCLNYEVRVLCCEPQEGCTVTHVTVPSTSSVSVTGHTRTTSREATSSATTVQTTSPTAVPITSTASVETTSTTSAPTEGPTSAEMTSATTAPTTSPTAVPLTSTNSVETTSPTIAPTTSTTTVETASTTTAPRTSTTTVETASPTKAPRTSTTTVETTSTTSAPTTSRTSAETTSSTSAPTTSTISTTSTTSAPTTSTSTVETTSPTSAPSSSTTFVPIPETTPSPPGTTSCQPQCTWTKWFDADFPSPGPHGGDFETYSNIIRRGEKICHRPEYISALECRAENHPDVSIQTLGQVVQCSPEVGLVCRNRDQKGKFRMCLNYEVRVLCCEPQKGCPVNSVTPFVTSSPQSSLSPESTTLTVSLVTSPSSAAPSTSTCYCSVAHGFYSAGSIIYQQTDLSGHCYYAVCSLDCHVVRRTDHTCPTSTPPPTPATSTPASSPSASVPVTQRGCPNAVPPRMKGETWAMPNCSEATCEGNGAITVRSRQCPKVQELTCANGYPAVTVANQEDCCPHYACQCVCSGWGDPHYITFDGTYYTLLDNCTYVLVQQIVPVFGHFRVLIDNYFCDAEDRLSCPQSIIVEYQQDRVVLTRQPVRGVMTNEIIFNGEVVRPGFQKDGIVVSQIGIKMYVAIPALGVQVMFSGLIFSVEVPFSKFSNNTEGQCGTCTNDQKDECRLPGGAVVSSCSDMSGHWNVTYPGQPSCHRPPLTPTTVEPKKSPTSCPPSPICLLILSEVFKPCHSVIPPWPYYQGCTFDQCHMPRGDVVCSSLELYAALCASLSVCIDWRGLTNHTCSFTCPADKVYRPCGPSNPSYCYMNDSANTLALPEAIPITEGCFCPEDMMLFSSGTEVCVPANCSSCLGPHGEPVEPGHTVSVGCQECTCKGSTQTLSCQTRPCPLPPACPEPGFVPAPAALQTGQCCPQYTCVCNATHCPAPVDCPEGSRSILTYKEGACCPTQNCSWTVCSINGTLYQPGAIVSSNLCEKCWCELAGGPQSDTFVISCETQICSTRCPVGFEYQTRSGQCCGECVQVACVMNTSGSSAHLFYPGESWSDPRSRCVTHECEKHQDGLVVVTTKKACLPLNCPADKARLSEDGCCLSCPQHPPQNRSTCTVYHKLQVLRQPGCSSVEPVRLTYCQGNCGDTSSVYSLEAHTVEHKCRCCRELRASLRNVTLRCEDGSSQAFSYTEVEECGCVGLQCDSHGGLGRSGEVQLEQGAERSQETGLSGPGCAVALTGLQLPALDQPGWAGGGGGSSGCGSSLLVPAFSIT
ncbi:mucin-5AC [Eschrichtius robustus]|uniref:mucin-5AC n=1 Tax=Eschrichtius robustus TaxID=9764 RepID=UPI0035C07139